MMNAFGRRFSSARPRPRSSKTRALVIGALALAFVGANVMPIASEDLPDIIIASSTFDSATAGYYAFKSGMFKKAGINVTYQPGGAGIPPAVAGGSIQIGANNIFNVIAGHTRGVPFTIVAPGAVFDKTDEDGYVGLIVKKSSTFKTGKDFAGKIIGVNELNGFNHLSAMAWIDATGGDSSTAKYVEIPAAAAGAAISAGRIDGSVITVPYLGQSLATGDTRVVTNAYSSVAPSYLGVAWFTTTQFADAHPDLIQRFSRVIRDASIYVNAHHEETVQMMADLAKVDPAVIRSSTRVSFAPYVTPPLIQPVIDLLAKYKVIDKSFPATEIISANAIKPGAR